MLERSYSKELEFIIKSLGINANMLARKSGISRDTVMILLNGDRRGKYSTLDKILEAFYISPEWFYDGNGKPFIKEHGSYKDAGKRIREIRLNNGLNQRAFSDICHIDHAALCRVENGKAKLSLTTAGKIAKGFNLDPEYLMYGFGENPK